MITYKKIGGIRFVRIGRVQISYCVCKPAVRPIDHAPRLTGYVIAYCVAAAAVSLVVAAGIFNV